MRSIRLPCGCIQGRDRELWLKLCDEHFREWNDLHVQALRERGPLDPIDHRPECPPESRCVTCWDN